MTTTKINQKEYLKKYLSSNIGDEKKQKKKKSKIKATVKIIDDDIDLSKIGTDGDDMDIFQTGEDAPQIVGVIDDRPPELQALDYQNSTKWKAVNNNFTNMLNQTKPSTSVTSGLTKECSPPKQRKKTDSKRPSTYFDDGDLSPHRRRDKWSDLSPKIKSKKSAYSPKRRQYSGDLSPKRPKSHKYNNEDLSLNSQKDSDLDLSPRRNKNKYYCEDSPKLRKSRRDSDGDLSPKRGNRGRFSEDDLHLKRSQQRQYSEDLSPLRCKDRKFLDYSTKRRRTPNQSDDDLSSKRSSRPNSNRDAVPNQSRTTKADSDLSPNRHQNTDYSPKRSRKSRFDLPYQRRSTSCDILLKRRSPSNKDNRPTTSRNERSRSGSFDLSPPRKSTNTSADRHNKREHFSRSSPPRHIKMKQEESPPPTHSKMMTKTLDGKTAGLSDAKSLRIENAKFKEREQKLFEKMTDDMSGRNADVVMRERATGKRRNFEEESEKQRKKDEKDKAKKTIYDRWGAGLKQVEDHKTRLEEISHEMNKPLARYSNDEDLDDYLKKQERDGDPMLEYIRQKEREKNKKRGIPEMPKYEGSFPDNRFNIRPGYRWDGVDRSNGFEKKWFETISKKKAVEEEAYRYSTEDM